MCKLIKTRKRFFQNSQQPESNQWPTDVCCKENIFRSRSLYHLSYTGWFNQSCIRGVYNSIAEFSHKQAR